MPALCLNSPALVSFRRYLYYLFVLHSRARSLKAGLTVRENISKFQRFEKRGTGSAEMKVLSVVLPLFLAISCVSSKQLFKYNCSFCFKCETRVKKLAKIVMWQIWFNRASSKIDFRDLKDSGHFISDYLMSKYI